MRKQRKDSSRNRLTPEQQLTVENWLFVENLGYAEVVGRIKDQFGVIMSVTGVGRIYRYQAQMRQAKELVAAHVKVNHLDETPPSEEEMRVMAIALTSDAVIHSACERPGQLKELLPYARLLIDSERNDIRRRRLRLAERAGNSEIKTSDATEMEKLTAYLARKNSAQS